jgi:hypothetical protein
MLQKVQIFMLSGLKESRCLLATKPAAEKSRSASEEVAYTAKLRRATFAKIGNLSSFYIHQSSRLSFPSFYSS